MSTATPTKPRNLYLLEFYTNSPTGVSGWEINYAWIRAQDVQTAKRRLENEQGKHLDCVITCEEQSGIFPLAGDFRVNTKDANLFIYE